MSLACSVILRPYSPFRTPATAGGDAELVEEVAEAVDVGEARQVGERQRLVGQERAGQQRQRAFFAPLIGILPSRRLPPLIQMLSTGAL
jgi:hypothetical protein